MARVVLRNAGFRELRTSEPVRRYVHEVAEDVSRAAGEPTEAVDTEVPRNRARSAVVGPRWKSEDMLRALGSRIRG